MALLSAKAKLVQLSEAAVFKTTKLPQDMLSMADNVIVKHSDEVIHQDLEMLNQNIAMLKSLAAGCLDEAPWRTRIAESSEFDDFRALALGSIMIIEGDRFEKQLAELETAAKTAKSHGEQFDRTGEYAAKLKECFAIIREGKLIKKEAFVVAALEELKNNPLQRRKVMLKEVLSSLAIATASDASLCFKP